MTQLRWAMFLPVLLLAGCPVPQPQNTIESERYETSTVTGTGYWLFVPANYRHDHPMPLVVTCHGTVPFDVANHHVRELKYLAEQYRWIVVAPELVGTDGILGNGPVRDMLEDERRILGIISSLGYRYNIDRNNVMITGFSGGGFPAHWVGLRNPDLFSVVVARNCNFSASNMEGWFLPEAKSTRILIYYGENDPGAIALQSRAGIEFLQSRGFSVATATIPGAGHERKPEVAFKFMRENLRLPKPSLPASPALSSR